VINFDPLPDTDNAVVGSNYAEFIGIRLGAFFVLFQIFRKGDWAGVVRPRRM